MHDKRQVAVLAQNLVEELIAGAALLTDHIALAAAGIHQQPQIEGQIGFLREVLDSLRLAFLIQQKIVLGEVLDEFPLLVADGGEQVHDIDVAGELRLVAIGPRGDRGCRRGCASLVLPGQQASRRQQGESREQVSPGDVGW